MGFTFGAVLEFLRDRFKGDFEVNEASHTVGIGVTVILSGDSERTSLTFVNLGVTTIYIAPSPDVSVTNGIRLGPNGGTVTMNLIEDMILPGVGWYALSSGAGGVLYTLWCRRSHLTSE